MGGDAEQVVAEVRRINSVSGVGEPGAQRRQVRGGVWGRSVSGNGARSFTGFALVAPSDCVLLGVSVGERAVSSSLAKRECCLRASTDRLIEHHDALVLLWLSLCHPRGVYKLSAGAAFRDPTSLALYDKALCETVERSLNLAINEAEWSQCKLPTYLGGVGVRSPSELAIPAFLSSASATSELADVVGRSAPDMLLARARGIWAETSGVAAPEGQEFSTWA